MRRMGFSDNDLTAGGSDRLIVDIDLRPRIGQADGAADAALK